MEDSSNSVVEESQSVNQIPSVNPNFPQSPSVQKASKMSNHNYWKFIVIFLFIIVLMLAGSLIYVLQKQTVSQLVVSNILPTLMPSSITPIIVDETATWKTYTNTKYNYSIQYPNDWAFREFSNTKDGAAFYNIALGDTVGGEPIVIQFMARAKQDKAIPFSDYVKVAAVKEIQNYLSLSTTNPVTTNSGNTGYTTTWKVASITNPQNISDSAPITYFDTKRKTGETIQVTGDNSNKQIYNQMLSTFTFTDSQDNSFQQVETLTNPMVWSQPQIDTYQTSTGRIIQGQSIKTKIPDKPQDKVAPLLASGSSLYTYGWDVIGNESAGGVDGQRVVFQKTFDTDTKIMAVQANYKTGEYTVFLGKL